jgi:hypothetical protein
MSASSQKDNFIYIITNPSIQRLINADFIHMPDNFIYIQIIGIFI